MLDPAGDEAAMAAEAGARPLEPRGAVAAADDVADAAASPAPVEPAEVLSAGLLLTPARPANAFEETVQRLLQSIRLGLIGPGERLPPERELAGMLEVSRDTLREAIASLAEAGWVVARRGRYGGTFVSDELPTAAPISAGADRDPMGPARAPRGHARAPRGHRGRRGPTRRRERAGRRRPRAAVAGLRGVPQRPRRAVPHGGLPPAPAHRRGDRGADASSRSWRTCACA